MPAPATFVYYTLGESLVHYMQCQFSMLSLLRFRDSADFRVLVQTDHPERFAWLAPAVELMPVSQAQVDAWKGPSGFFWRTKIKAIQAAMQASPGQHVLYLDGDTFFRHPPTALIERLEQGDCLMHKREYNVAGTRRSVARGVWRLHGDQDYAGTPCNQDSDMWNAGLIGIAQDQPLLVDRTLACVDAMEAAGRQNKYNEQFGFSLVFSATGRLRAGNDVVDHYWGNKRRWNAEIARVLLQALLAGETPLQTADRLAGMDLPLKPFERNPWLWRKWLKRSPEYRLIESMLR